MLLTEGQQAKMKRKVSRTAFCHTSKARDPRASVAPRRGLGLSHTNAAD